VPQSSFVHSLVLVSVLAGSGNLLLAKEQFEGVIESKNTTTDDRGRVQQFTMTMYVRHDRVRIENSQMSSAPGSTMIYRGDKKLVWMLNEEDKTYFEIRQDEEPRPLYSPSPTNATKPFVRRTGKKKQVLGYVCEQVIVKEVNLETEIWATKSLGDVYAAISKVLGGESALSNEGWENMITKMGYYPLIASTKIQGKVMESQEVTKIERKQLPAEVFELPAGFKKQSAGGMME
jgi:hypothetical protein